MLFPISGKLVGGNDQSGHKRDPGRPQGHGEKGQLPKKGRDSEKEARGSLNSYAKTHTNSR